MKSLENLVLLTKQNKNNETKNFGFDEKDLVSVPEGAVKSELILSKSLTEKINAEKDEAVDAAFKAGKAEGRREVGLVVGLTMSLMGLGCAAYGAYKAGKKKKKDIEDIPQAVQKVDDGSTQDVEFEEVK